MIIPTTKVQLRVENTICAICGKTGGGLFTVRQLWIDNGGWGSIPPEARVHVSCDNKEQRGNRKR